jgi:hypothetical protein
MPEAATSPYPRQQEPALVEHSILPAGIDTPAPRWRIGARGVIFGAAAIGTGVAAAVSAFFYARKSRRASSVPKSGADDKSKRGKPDRSRVAAGEQYELRYFARKHGIGADEARKILEKAGPNRDAANALARKRG